MKKSLLSLAVASACFTFTRKRAITNDISFGYRMGAGFPGDPNRTHPFSVVPGLINQSTPPRFFGDPVIIDTSTNSYRAVGAGDTATFNADGFVVRPYPTQQTAGGLVATIGTGVPSLNQPIDILSDGFIIVKCNVGTPTKGGAVYVYTGADTGNHKTGGLESAAGTNLTLISNAFFNGPPDANGVTEVRITASKI